MPIINLVYEAPQQWRPGANTIAYYPLSGDFKDYSGNGHDGTKSGNISFTTSGNLTYGDAIGGYTAGYVGFTLPSMTSSSYTLNVWCKITAYSQGYRWYSIVGIGNICISMCGTDVGGGYHRAASVVVGTRDGISNYTMPEQTWMNLVGVFTTTGMKCYVNGQQVYTDSYSYSFSGSGGKLFSRDALTTGDYYGALSEVIIEDKAWTAQEISDYYNQTKSNYGL